MSANKKPISPAWVDPDDAPDISTAEWQAKAVFKAAPRGRPKVGNPKEMTTIRLDADVIAFFRSAGPGWQSRINEELKRAVARSSSRKKACLE